MPPVFAYVPFIADALRRSLDNAIKFCPDEGGEIWVSAQEVDGQVRIAVRDDGVVIPAEEQTRIFDRFYQVNRDLYEQQGVGLGLPIAQSIVELHHGTIEVRARQAREAHLPLSCRYRSSVSLLLQSDICDGV